MFLSASFLSIEYGVDDEIAKYFTDREPPANNLYWKDKLLYLRPQPGWLFIPLIVDLLYKCGTPKASLLSDPFVSTMEQIGHITALEETGQITWGQAVEQCIELVKESHLNPTFFTNLVQLMQGEKGSLFTTLVTPFEALHRGDNFLLALCVLPLENSKVEQIVALWFALIGTLLLLDDADDLKVDKETGDANAFIESGLTKEGLQQIEALVKTNIALIGTKNRAMAAKLNQGFTSLYTLPQIKQLQNQ